jgi:predicted MPP superfamily phosphohydrolase
MKRRHFMKAMSAAGTAGLGMGLYAWRIEPHWVEFVHRIMPVKSLPEHLVGKTLVQLSDIHVGPQVDDAFVRAVFRDVQSLKPDIVVATGDFVTYHDQVQQQAAMVYADLPRGRLATIGVWGNHDYGPDWSCCEYAGQLERTLKSSGLTLLQNAAVEVEGLRVIGLDDRWGPNFDPAPILATTEAGAPTIVLSHNPDNADLPVWGDFDGWILAGHTHGGQCKPPFLPAPKLSVENRRYTSGVFDVGSGRRLYISRGLGHKARLRFNVRPEVTVFSLTRAA